MAHVIVHALNSHSTHNIVCISVHFIFWILLFQFPVLIATNNTVFIDMIFLINCDLMTQIVDLWEHHYFLFITLHLIHTIDVGSSTLGLLLCLWINTFLHFLMFNHQLMKNFVLKLACLLNWWLQKALMVRGRFPIYFE